MYTLQLLGVGTEFEMLYFSVVDNLDFFYFTRDKYWYGNGFVNLLRDLLCHLHWYEQSLIELYNEAPRFDLNNKVQGNGFRSFIFIFERCFTECYKFSKRLQSSRNSCFFRASHYLNEADCLVKILNGLKSALLFLKKMMANSFDNHLLMPDKTFTAEELIVECGDINQLVFYGRYQSFYYCPSMRRILQGVGIIMATFSDLYQTSGGPISRAALTVINCLKYIFNPELRAQEIVDVAQNSSVEFLKSFWRLGESQFMTTLPRWICPKFQVREEILVPDQPIVLRNILSGVLVTIPAPSSHIPPAPVRCILMSTLLRKGQMANKYKFYKEEELSPSILFHCHGGGFISQSPESHEIYLRHWAKDLNVPIFSVDYSLSPEAPFPRALEEVLLAYAWVLQNPQRLGWTGERICFAGDSAGGNILLGIILKTISLGIRKPDAVLCAYSPLVLDMVPSPSRLLCWIDPLLPLGFMLSCLDAYGGSMQTDGNEYDEEPNQELSGRRSRKISSISEIFDSSMNFIKQSEWMEVEANEPSVVDEDSAFCSDKKQKLVKETNYVHQFMDDYSAVNFNETNEEMRDYKEHTLFSVPRDIVFDLKTKWESVADSTLQMVSETLISSSLYQKFIAPFVPYKKYQNLTINQLSDAKVSINEKMKNLKMVSRNPFMSPLLASDENLKEMPQIFFVTLNFDPCLDDTITFAKRLTELNRPVEVDVLDGLPHGFLNFLPFSKEAHDGSDQCVRRLKEALLIS